MNPTEKAGLTFAIARELAPAFRDKFDFSQRSSRPGDPSHFELLADISFQAAEAMVKKCETVLAEAQAQEKKEREAAHA